MSDPSAYDHLPLGTANLTYRDRDGVEHRLQTEHWTKATKHIRRLASDGCRDFTLVAVGIATAIWRTKDGSDWERVA